MRVLVKHGKRKEGVEVEPPTVPALRVALERAFRVPEERQRVILKGRVISGEGALEEAGVGEGARLLLVGNAVEPLASAAELDAFRLPSAPDDVQVCLLRAGEVADAVAAFVGMAEEAGEEGAEAVAAAAGVDRARLPNLFHHNSEIFTRVVLGCDALTRDSCAPDTYEAKRALTKKLLALCERLDALRSRL